MENDPINDFERELRAYAEGNGHWSRVEGARDALRKALDKQAAEPLTDEQIEAARLAEFIPFGDERSAFIKGIRFAERTHSIKP